MKHMQRYKQLVIIVIIIIEFGRGGRTQNMGLGIITIGHRLLETCPISLVIVNCKRKFFYLFNEQIIKMRANDSHAMSLR